MKNKRFIAGASCPKCSEMDKIFTFESEDKKYRACTRCDFKEEMRFENNKKELETRVNRIEEQTSESAQVVRLMEPVNMDAENIDPKKLH